MSRVNGISVWSGFCDICHENGFSGNSVNYDDYHYHFGDDCHCCFDDGYGCDVWNQKDHVRQDNLVECWHFHRMCQEHMVTSLHPSSLVLKPPDVMD